MTEIERLELENSRLKSLVRMFYRFVAKSAKEGRLNFYDITGTDVGKEALALVPDLDTRHNPFK